MGSHDIILSDSYLEDGYLAILSHALIISDWLFAGRQRRSTGVQTRRFVRQETLLCVTKLTILVLRG